MLGFSCFRQYNLTLIEKHYTLVEYVSLYVCIIQDDEEAGLLEQVKSQICDNVALYAQKYDEEFSPHLPGFVTAIWHLLTSTGQGVKYDLVSKSLIMKNQSTNVISYKTHKVSEWDFRLDFARRNSTQ